ncbi:MAG: DUF2130 domain-containing protein [Chitinophagaceae bacterium]|nr:DUF2130 domain-containing protein [Chitinophagaceae bacterium]MCW5904639.1 DUF2130 domain-containing protein [Chitinophagaceae bacterium]
MAGFIICPKCHTEFEPTDAFREEIQRELRDKAKEWQDKKEKEFLQKEQTWQQQMLDKEKETTEKHIEEKQKLQQELQERLQKTIAADFENKLKLMQQTISDNEEKLKTARQKELEILQLQKSLQEKEEEMEITVQKQLLVEREKMKLQIQKEEQEKIDLRDEKHKLEMKEKDKFIEDQKKLIEEMKRKAEQGSMQLQGEVQELLLEELLKNSFPFDTIQDVPKGVRGADCIQTVKSQLGFEAGKIIFESKRTKDFQHDWIEKLKKDMRQLGADVAVIVTQTYPKDMEKFGEKDGVYICSFSEVKSVVLLLRHALIKINDAKKSQENKGDKMVMLYDYLTSNEFTEQWKAIREGFMSMKASINKERDAMEKLWKAREKQLEKVLLNAAHIHGSIEGIAGADTINLSLDYDDKLLAEE